MNTIRKYAKFTYLNAKNSFNSFYTYKVASLLNFITQIVIVLAQFYLWKAIYNNTGRINDYDFTNMIDYIVLSFALARLYPFNVSAKFGELVKSGEVIHSLLKPVAFEYQLLTDSLGELIYKLCFISTPIVLTGYIFLGLRLRLSLIEVISFLVFWLSAYVFIFILELFIGVFSYYTQSLWGIRNFKTAIISLLAGKWLPLNFYPVSFRALMYYLPFSSIYFIPINILMKKDDLQLMPALVIIWLSSIFILILYRVVADIMIKQTMIQGG